MSDSLDRQIRLLRNQDWSARDPSGRAFAPLADAYRRRGDLEEAQSIVEDGVERHPDFTSGHLVAALVARDRGDRRAAGAHLDRVIELDPENVTALLERSQLALSSGAREAGLTDLREVLRLEPKHGEAEHLLSQALEQMEAEPARGEGVDLELDHEAEPAAAVATDELGVEEIAVVPEPDAEQEEEWDPAPAPVADDRVLQTRTMGDLYARQGLVDRAIEVYEQLAATNPEDGALSARLEELRGSKEVAAEVQREVPASAKGPLAPAARSISAYLGDLLAWVPGAVPIESLAPARGEKIEGAVPIESLAPSPEVPAAAAVADPEDERPASEHEAASAADRSSEGPADENDLDDFQSWLSSLEP